MHSQQSAAAQMEKVWAALVESAERLCLLRIQFEVHTRWLPDGFLATWEKHPSQETEKSWRIDVPVMSEAHVVGWLTVVGASTRASNRQHIASLLEVLDTSESYLTSVFKDHSQVSASVPAPYSDLIRKRAVPSAATAVDANLEQA
jgi:hypothetical protein